MSDGPYVRGAIWPFIIPYRVVHCGAQLSFMHLSNDDSNIPVNFVKCSLHQLNMSLSWRSV